MGSNIIELAKLGHQRAAELKASCGAVDVRSFAQLISDLATQLEVQLVRGNALAAESAGLKAGVGFFSYDSSGCYEEHDTAEEAVAYAEDSISEYRDNAPDGWSDEVGSVVWGVIMQRATMTGLRPVTEEDNVAPHIEEFCDYTLQPNIETPATDAFLAEVRAQARNEGINYAAGRLAAAFNHGFVDKPLTEVCDVVRMILDAKEELANSTLPAADGISGEYAEKFLAEFAAQLRKGTAL
ncbi:TPA: hypothetical protein ACTYSP_003599 [Citrobacter freundii]